MTLFKSGDTVERQPGFRLSESLYPLRGTVDKTMELGTDTQWICLEGDNRMLWGKFYRLVDGD